MKIHVLTGNDNGQYSVAVHVDTPIGPNVAGKEWSQCLIGNGKNDTSLPNLQADDVVEYNAIIAGTRFETVMQIKRAENLIELNALVDKQIVEELKKLQRKYRYYGLEVD